MLHIFDSFNLKPTPVKRIDYIHGEVRYILKNIIFRPTLCSSRKFTSSVSATSCFGSPAEKRPVEESASASELGNFSEMFDDCLSEARSGFWSGFLPSATVANSCVLVAAAFVSVTLYIGGALKSVDDFALETGIGCGGGGVVKRRDSVGVETKLLVDATFPALAACRSSMELN